MPTIYGMRSPLILTLTLDPALFHRLDEMRAKYFPSDRNFLAAHVTLFHHLPGETLETVVSHLQSVCEKTQKFNVDLPTVRFLGRGVALDLHSPQLLVLRASLVSVWIDWLTRQDQQKYQPHVTVQNKVDAAVAANLFNLMSSSWVPLKGQAVGLSLWFYRNGPWEPAESFRFEE